MPVYVYKCPECGDTVEKVHNMDEFLMVLCPICTVSDDRGVTMDRQISGGVQISVKGGTPKFHG